MNFDTQGSLLHRARLALAATVFCAIAAAQQASITSAQESGSSSVQISVTVSGASDEGLEFSEAQFKDANGNSLTSTALSNLYTNGPHVLVVDKPAGAAKVRIKHKNGTTSWVDITPPPN